MEVGVSSGVVVMLGTSVFRRSSYVRDFWKRD